MKLGPTFIARFRDDELGATAIEYALITVVIGVALIALLGEMGGAIRDVFAAVKSGFDG